MDFHSRRITAILENALREDSATRDATSYAVVEASQRGTGTIMAKQDCILAGIGIVPRILDVFSALDGTVVAHPEVTSHPEIFDGVRLHRGGRSDMFVGTDRQRYKDVGSSPPAGAKTPL